MTEISVDKLAAELKLSIPEVLQRADDAIEKLVSQGGIEAARGYSTASRRIGPVTTIVTISEPLADLLRLG